MDISINAPIEQQLFQVSQQFLDLYGGAGGQVVVMGDLYSIVGKTPDGLVELKLEQAGIGTGVNSGVAPSAASPTGASPTSTPAPNTAPNTSHNPGGAALLQSLGNGDVALNPIKALYPSAAPAPLATPPPATPGGLATVLNSGMTAASPAMQYLQSRKGGTSGTPGFKSGAEVWGGGSPSASINTSPDAIAATNQSIKGLNIDIQKLNNAPLSTSGKSFDWYAKNGGADAWAVPPLAGVRGHEPGLWDYLGPVAEMVGDLVMVYRYDQRDCGRSTGGPPYDMTTARCQS